MTKVTAIILAGGRGSRMKSDVPKQYLMLGGHTVLYYTIKAFVDSDVTDIVLVCGADDIDYVKNDIAAGFTTDKNIKVTAGGKERYDSVYQGLLACEGTDYVLIHDGARCCISTALINNMVSNADSRKSYICAVPVKDTIKCVEDGVVTETLPRTKLVSVQTPQGFEYDKILLAHNIFREAQKNDDPRAAGITDDAMLMEIFSDEKVFVCDGEDTNIKITTPSDMEIAERILSE